jgi:hypothetical protein
VREHRIGTKHLHHPDVGDLDLSYEGMELSNHRDLQLIAWTAEPSTRSHDALQLLGNLAASTSTQLRRARSSATSALTRSRSARP